jgi:hypothetical protein
MTGVHGHDLRDSLWFFDGHDMRVWIEMHDVLSSASADLGRELPVPVKIPIDFYPLSALINKAILFGVESELVQRRDTNFAYMRFGTRVRERFVANTPANVPADAPLPSGDAASSFGAVQPSCSPTSKPPLPALVVLPSRPRDLTA